MVRKTAAALVAFAMLVPVASGAPAIWGTEEHPELADPADNVQYSPLHTGGEREHVDLLAGWLEYDAVNDTLNATLKLKSLEHVNESTDDNWFVLYGFRGNVTHGGEVKGELRFGMLRSHSSGEWSPSVDLNTESGEVDVPFTFQRHDGTPGYFRWYVPMGYLQNWGDQMETFHAGATEEKFVRPLISSGVINYNLAQADGAFVWKDLEPAPVNTTDDELLTPRSPEPTSTTSAESVAVGLAASAAAILTAFAWRRRSA